MKVDDQGQGQSIVDGKLSGTPNPQTAMQTNSPVLRRPIIIGNLTLASPSTQTTIGGNGSASAMPTPLGYILVQIGNTQVAVAYFNKS